VTFGVLLALDVVMVQYLESRGAAEVARTMAAEDVTIELGSFPFTPRFFGGKLTNVSVRVRGASASGGLRVQLVEAQMEEAQFNAGEIFALARSSFATKSKVVALGPIGVVELGEGDLNDFIRRSMPIVGDVQVNTSGVAVRFLKPGVEPADPERPSDDEMTKPARYVPRVDDRRLHMILTSASQIPTEYRAEAERLEDIIQLPRFPAGLAPPNVDVAEDVIVIEAKGEKVTLNVGEATDA
jgi:hypothetical protein